MTVMTVVTKSAAAALFFITSQLLIGQELEVQGMAVTVPRCFWFNCTTSSGPSFTTAVITTTTPSPTLLPSVLSGDDQPGLDRPKSRTGLRKALLVLVVLSVLAGVVGQVSYSLRLRETKAALRAKILQQDEKIADQEADIFRLRAARLSKSDPGPLFCNDSKAVPASSKKVADIGTQVELQVKPDSRNALYPKLDGPEESIGTFLSDASSSGSSTSVNTILQYPSDSGSLSSLHEISNDGGAEEPIPIMYASPPRPRSTPPVLEQGRGIAVGGTSGLLLQTAGLAGSGQCDLL